MGFPEEYFYQSPSICRADKKRRAAIAGVLAMKPEVLILDEPTAGLDPKGRDEILDQIARLQKEARHYRNSGISQYGGHCQICGSDYCHEPGSVLFDDSPKESIRHGRELEEVGLAVPQVTYILRELEKNGDGSAYGCHHSGRGRAEILQALEMG